MIIQDRYRPAYSIDAGAKYEFWHKKARLSLNGQDIFNTRRWSFLQVSDGVTFTYWFGNSGGARDRGAAQKAERDVRIENR
jgi:hypothetical protein